MFDVTALNYKNLNMYVFQLASQRQVETFVVAIMYLATYVWFCPRLHR